MKNPVRFFATTVFLALLAVTAAVQAADVKVFCSLPMRGPVAGLADAFLRDTGHRVEFVFGVSTDLVKRVAAGEAADAVLFGRSYFEDSVKTGKVLAGSRTEVGRISVGVMARAGAAAPDVSTPEKLKRAVLDADSLAFNQRTSGKHFAAVLERLGIAGEVKGRSKRPDVDQGVFEHVQKGKGKDFGIATIAVIMADGGKTVRLVGPLPEELQLYDPYVAGLTANAKSPDAASAFIRFLTSPQTKATLAKRGVGQAE
jgi:molybdate transport system substrate-binding protein